MNNYMYRKVKIDIESGNEIRHIEFDNKGYVDLINEIENERKNAIELDNKDNIELCNRLLNKIKDKQND